MTPGDHTERVYRGSAISDALVVPFGAVATVYLVGLFISLWRLARITKKTKAPKFGRVAFVALAVGWPTGLRAQRDLLNGRRNWASLANERTTPLLTTWAVLLPPVFVLGVLPIGQGSSNWGAVLDQLAALMLVGLACAIWLRDRILAVPPPDGSRAT